MFSFSCGMLLGESESWEDTGEASGGVTHVDAPAVGLLAS